LPGQYHYFETPPPTRQKMKMNQQRLLITE
jgi:hypothetical protein